MKDLMFDQLNQLQAEIQSTLRESRPLTTKQKKDYRKRFEDCLIDFFIDGFVSGLLEIGEDKDLPDFYRFLDIRYKDGETVFEKFDKELEDAEALKRLMESEGNRVWNEGVLQSAKGTENVWKRWVAVMDNRTRDTHFLLDGVTIPIDAEFVSLSGDTALAPGMFETAEECCNCRCSISLSKR